MTETAVAIIEPAAIRHNLQRLREAAPGCHVMAVIKANAYGHGIVEMGQMFADVDALGVARVAEGALLRGQHNAAREHFYEVAAARVVL